MVYALICSGESSLLLKLKEDRGQAGFKKTPDPRSTSDAWIPWNVPVIIMVIEVMDNFLIPKDKDERNDWLSLV